MQTEQDPGLVIPLGGQNPLLLQAQALVQAAAQGQAGNDQQQGGDQAAAAPQPVLAPQPAVNITKFSTESIEFILYTDPELEMHRHLVPLPPKDRNRLSRQTISSMRTKTLQLTNPREPEKSEILQMAQALCLRYPGLRDPEKPAPTENWVSLRNIYLFFFLCTNICHR